MAIQETTCYDFEAIVSMANGNRSIEAADTGALENGTVVGQVTADGSYVQLNPAATDGTEIAAGVVVSKGVIAVRDCEISDGKLVWPTGITAIEKAAAIDELKARHIITVESF